jgi:uncharacterized protein YjbJ (UPF0337 family)
MEWDFEENRWPEARNRIKSQWGELSDAHLDEIAGRRQMLVVMVERHCNVNVETANEQVDEWASQNRDLIAETAEQIKPYVGIARQ